jgi:hypothetical protein
MAELRPVEGTCNFVFGMPKEAILRFDAGA